MHSIKTLCLTSLLLAAVACGGSSAEPAEPAGNATPEATPTAASDDGDLQAVCVATMTRQRECTDEFIPALVDLRIELDKPAGIAERAASEGGRDELIATAREEWAEDGKDENIAASCERITASMGEQGAAMKAAAQECLAESACDPFVTCTLDLMRGHLK